MKLLLSIYCVVYAGKKARTLVVVNLNWADKGQISSIISNGGGELRVCSYGKR